MGKHDCPEVITPFMEPLHPQSLQHDSPAVITPKCIIPPSPSVHFLFPCHVQTFVLAECGSRTIVTNKTKIIQSVVQSLVMTWGKVLY